ncbi:MAG: phosphate ABC transporter substrate-binding protein [Oscillospiraceae bacterium]|jgi:phosphate transport system substrate-binding protein|nr:phosphate ABC transporter substrate-binding protein [Oscillospiraceae bacterium]
MLHLRLKKLASVLISISLFFGGMVFAPSCGSASDSIIAAGSTSVQPYAEVLAEAYHALYSDRDVEIQGGGSSAGISSALSGIAEIGMSSREIKDSEKEVLESVGKEMLIYEIAKDGLAIIINPENPICDLSLEQIRGVYSADIANWKEIGGKDAKIHVITREEGSGTRDAFSQLVMGENQITPKAIVQDSNGAVRLLVAEDPNSIGFISLGLVAAEPGQKEVKALCLGGIAPSFENIENGSYGLFRPFLFVAVVDEGKEAEGLTKHFIDFTLSGEGQKILASRGLVVSD